MKRSVIISIALLLHSVIAQDSGYAADKPSAVKPGSAPVVVTSGTIDLRQTGLRVYDPKRCYDGYVLFNYLPPMLPPPRGKIPRQIALVDNFTPIYLIDPSGHIIYRWVVKAFVGFSQLDEKGHLFYITMPSPDHFIFDTDRAKIDGLYELDDKGDIDWYYPALAHHDFQILPDGQVLMIHNIKIPLPSPKLPGLSGHEFVLGEHIDIITRDKRILWSWQAEDHIPELENIAGTKIQPFKGGAGQPVPGDWLHLNTCEALQETPLAQKDPRFRKGNILFCSFYMNIICIIEYPSGKIVWSFGPGILDGPHSPTMLDNGNILIFDNGRKRQWARVIEVDPLTKQIVWEYHATPPRSFFSPALSNATRLPNGNTFICDGANNRLFEITPEGEVVWDMIPAVDTTAGQAGILKVMKYPYEHLRSFFKNTGIEQDKKI